MRTFAVVAAPLLTLLACAPPQMHGVGAPERPRAPAPVHSGPGGPAIDDPRVASIVAAYTTSMSNCPERVWQGHDWNDNRVVLLQKSTARAWVWSGAALTASHEVEVDEVDPATLPPELAAFDFYSVGILDDAVTLGIDLDETDDGAFGNDYVDLAILLAFHEGFHNLGGQDDFVVTDTGGRDPVLPLDWQPRFLRDEEIMALGKALGGDNALGVARHWQDRYGADAAADRASMQGMDVIEGTAQYVESVAAIVAKLGCGATDAEIAAEAALHVDQLVVDPQLDAGGESYALGPAAGLLLRAHGQGFEQQARSTPLAEILLADVDAAAVDENDSTVTAMAQQAQTAIDGLNADVVAQAQPLFAAWDDDTAVRLAFPYDAIDGSFGYQQGFVFGARSDQAHVLFDVFATYLPSSGSASLDDVNVVEDDVACGDAFVVPLASSAATRTGDVISAHVGGLAVDGVHVRDVVVDGRTWWCVQ